MDTILIAVMASNRVIGRENVIPWHIPEELRFFKRTTMGFPVLMGRKTYASLTGPLPGRRNIVISRNPDFRAEGIECVNSLEKALALCQDAEKAFILGGQQIFELAMATATGIILSVLDRPFEGDTFFPAIPPEIFQEVDQQRHQAGEPFTVITYRRRVPSV